MKNLVLAGLLLVVGIALVLLLRHLSSGPPTQAHPDPFDHPDVIPGEDLYAPPEDGAGRADVPVVVHAVDPAAPDPGSSRHEPALVRVSGLVLDVGGSPLTGVPVATEATPRRALAESDGAGRFELELEMRGRITLVVFEGEFAAVRNWDLDPASPEDSSILVAAPAIDLGGTVVEESGPPVPGARVILELRDDLLREFPRPLDRARRVYRSVLADEEGHFGLERVPAVAGALLSVDQQGFESFRRDAPLESHGDLVLELRPSAENREVIEGIVLLPDGSPVADAAVQYAHHETRTGADGRFTLPCDPDVAAELPLGAGKPGHGTALVPRFGELVRTFGPFPPPFQTLVLDGARWEIAGKVVDADGEPRSGWVVRIEEGTPLTENSFPPDTVENLGGAKGHFTTGPDGDFRISGLRDRSYVLHAHHFQTLENFRTPPIAAGTENLRLVIPANRVLERVRGRVVSRSGGPLPDVHVALFLYTYRTATGQTSLGGESTVTDEEGEFELADVPVESIYLNVASDAIVPIRYHILPGDDPEALVIEVAVRRHFRVIATGGRPAEAHVQMLDARGEPLDIFAFDARGWSSTDRVPLRGGRTGVHAVSEDAVELLVVEQPWAPSRREVLRRAVRFVPGEVTELHIELD